MKSIFQMYSKYQFWSQFFSSLKEKDFQHRAAIFQSFQKSQIPIRFNKNSIRQFWLFCFFIPDEFQLILMGLTVTPTRWSTCCFKLKTFHKKVMPYSEFSHFLLNCFGMRTMHSAKAKALSGEFSVRQAHREVVKIKEIFFLLGFSLEVHLEDMF